MAETLTGGQRGAASIKARDPDFFKKIGAKGGSKGKAQGVIKGFAANPELARRAGLIGGKVSRRGKKVHA